MIGNTWGIIAGLSWVFWTIHSINLIFTNDSFGYIMLLSSLPSGFIFLYWVLVERLQS